MLQSSQIMVILQVLITSLIFFVPWCKGNTENCTQASQTPAVLCSMRYDIFNGYLDEIYANATCGEWYINKPICNAELKIQHYEIAPYMYTLPNGDVDGIIPALLNIVMKTCCLRCTRLVYMKPFKSIKETTRWFYNTTAYSVMVPALATSTSTKYFGKPFVKLMGSPGVTYVTIDKSAEKFMNKTMESFGGTWPLLVLVALLTIEGGIIIWLLDQRKNPEEFPRSFIRGTLEGTWWSYVSITTVGYGDKTPRSIQGRLFAVLWITFGIATSSMLTASLSSSLTSAALPEKTSLRALKVGFLRQVVMSYEENIIYREGGKPIAYYEAKEMVNALHNGIINGILLDSLVLDYHWDTITKTGLDLQRKTDIKGSNTGIGMMFSGPHLQPWADFIHSFMLENKDAESRLLTESINAMKVKFSTGNAYDDSTGNMMLYKGYKSIIIAASICCGITFAIGIIFEFLRKWYSTNKKQSNVEDHEMEKRNNNAEQDDRFEKLSKQMENMQDTFIQLRHEYGKRSLKA